jgi:S1-C subfamily serine protease
MPAPPKREEETPTILLVAGGVLKAAAIGAGAVGTMLGLMGVVGGFVESGWVRVPVAVVVGLGVPLFIADRLLPKDPTKGGFGVVTDVLAILWLGFTFAFAGLAHGASEKLLAREGDRLTSEGFSELGAVAYVLAGVSASPASTPPAGSASAGAPAASGSAPAPLGAPAQSASASAPASASASASAPPRTPPASKGEKTPAELFKELAPSVVTIFTKEPAGEGSGTGFLIDDGGTLATNHHVIDGASAVRVKFMSGAVFESVELLVDAAAIDLALLHVELAHPVDGGAPVRAAPLSLGDSDAVVVGERAISIGNPLGLEHTLTDGLISARRLYEGRAWIQMSVPVSPGNSGGPLFDLHGDVVGITTQQVLGGMFGRAQNLNLAIPVNELKKLVAPTYPERRRFGDAGGKSQW